MGAPIIVDAQIESDQIRTDKVTILFTGGTSYMNQI